jgi:hypothetical protein
MADIENPLVNLANRAHAREDTNMQAIRKNEQDSLNFQMAPILQAISSDQKRISLLPEDDPKREQLLQSLAMNIGKVRNMYGDKTPDDEPGRISQTVNALRQHFKLGGKSKDQLEAAQKEKSAKWGEKNKKMAGEYAGAIPPSDYQVEMAQGAERGVPEDLRKKAGQTKWLESMGEIAKPVAEKDLNKPDVVSLTLKDGSVLSAQWAPDASLPTKGKWKYLNGTDIPDTLLGGAVVTPKSTGPKVGTFGDFMLAAYGQHPTAQQYVQGRQKWAEAVAGTTSGTHMAFVPQADFSIKAISVQTTSSKHIGGGGSSGLPTNRADVNVPSQVPDPVEETTATDEPYPSEPAPSIPVDKSNLIPASEAAKSIRFAPKPGYHLVTPRHDKTYFLWQSDTDPNDVVEARAGVPKSSGSIKKGREPKGPVRTSMENTARKARGGDGGGVASPGATVGGKKTPAQSKAETEYAEAIKLQSLANSAVASPSSQRDFLLADNLLHGALGRVNEVEIRKIFSAGGWGEAPSRWMSRASKGELSPNLRRQLQEYSNDQVNATKDAMNALDGLTSKPSVGGSKKSKGGGFNWNEHPVAQ